MADKLPFFAAESGTWRTTSPDPHIDLSGTALTLGTYPAQTFKAAADDATLDFATTNTCTITAWKDATNWKRYEGAVWTDAATDTLDLSAATLMGAAGSIANGDAVSVAAGLPVITAASLGAVNTANSPNANEFARFTDADTIEGRTYAETRADLDLEVGVDLARWLTDVAGASNDNNTAAVNTRVVTDISGYSADRTTTLPATFAVGDLVEVYVSVGDDTYAQIIAPAAGDTIDGGSEGAEWSRLFITGEKVRFRGVTANAAWTVDYDGRITVIGTHRNDEGQAISTSTVTVVGLSSVAGNVNVGNIFDYTNDKLLCRRSGQWMVQISTTSPEVFDENEWAKVAIFLNSTSVCESFNVSYKTTNGRLFMMASKIISVAAGDYVQFKIAHAEGATVTWGTGLALGIEMTAYEVS
jgi:hypothetical protein